jgi:tRNA(Ile)-lysidine synthase
MYRRMKAPDPDLVDRFRKDLAALTGQADRVAVAFSGGPDSLALLLLARSALPGRVAAATVDHALRPESAAEAAHAAALCQALQIPHATLRVKVQPSPGGLQAAAREARYCALAEWMKEEELTLLLTGHHLDDQAETLLMRLLRGSGVGGLAGIRPLAPFPAAGPDARLCRPLLAWRRAELAGIIAASGLEPVQDPSNTDFTYDRSRLRARLAEAPWLLPDPIARSAAALSEAQAALEWAADRLEAERMRDVGHGVSLDADGLPPELLRRLVLRAIRRVDPSAEPRGEALTRLIDTLQAGGGATLAGIKAAGRPLWHFEPAPPRRIV